MKRWYIKCTNTATGSNPGFPEGEVHEFWYGKEQKLIAKFSPEYSTSQYVANCYIKEDGFTTKAAATKAYNSQVLLSREYTAFTAWDRKVELIEIEV